MNIKTNLPEEYVDFVDTTRKENKYFKLFGILIVNFISSFVFYLLFKYLNE